VRERRQTSYSAGSGAAVRRGGGTGQLPEIQPDHGQAGCPLWHHDQDRGGGVRRPVAKHGNLRDAHKLLAAHRKGTPYAEFTVSTYGQNKLKAWRIVNGEDPLALITANKTRSFFQNISDPEDVVPVTIDGHMLNMWRGRRENLVGLSFPTKLYAQVAEDVRILAREHQMIPCQMQGVLWLTWRRLHGIRSTQQQELWDADLLAARLGFHAPNS